MIDDLRLIGTRFFCFGFVLRHWPSALATFCLRPFAAPSFHLLEANEWILIKLTRTFT